MDAAFALSSSRVAGKTLLSPSLKVNVQVSRHRAQRSREYDNWLANVSVPAAAALLASSHRERRRHACRAVQDILGTELPEETKPVEVEDAAEQLLRQFAEDDKKMQEAQSQEHSVMPDVGDSVDSIPLSRGADILADYEKKQEPKEPAIAVEIREDLVVVRTGFGLYIQDKPGKWVEFEDGARGILVCIKEDIAVIALSEGEVLEGETVKRTSKVLRMRYGKSLRGRILNVVGDPIDDLPWPDEFLPEAPVFQDEKPIYTRSATYRGLVTGVMGVDSMVPIGRGQTMLFQGTDREKDKKYLWPDLMSTKVQDGQEQKDWLNVCVCNSMRHAEELRSELQARGVWEHCAIFVPVTEKYGEAMIAMHAAMSFCEMACDAEDTEATVVGDFESMFEVFNTIQMVAGKERAAKGVLCDPKEEKYVQMNGTIISESICERRRFWFAIVSRANNSKSRGSVTLLPWMWEQPGGFDYRKWTAFQKKLEQIEAIPRITDETREKLLVKVKEQASKDGIYFESGVADESALLPQGNGVPNWEIEEMKSISDGHVMLRPPPDPEEWSWSIDLYRSLPRLGTDALHAALISVDAAALRLRMLQGKDRANLLHETRGPPMLNDTRGGLELEFGELLLQQPSKANLSIAEEVARIVIVSDPLNKRLRGPDGKPSRKNLEELTQELLDSKAGRDMQEEVQLAGIVTSYTLEKITEVVATWR